MKRILYNYLLLALAVPVFFGCKQDDFMLYDTVSYIQFGPDYSRIYWPSYNYTDTVKTYTFYYDAPSVMEAEVYFDLYTIGGPKKHNRPFKLQQVDVAGANNAVPGVNYAAFDSEEMKAEYVMPKGEVHMLVPIRVKRSATSDVYTLQFELVATDDFRLGEEKLLWRRVEFTSDLQKPAGWTASVTSYYYGVYSRTKHEFMIEVTGKKWDNDFFTILFTDSAEIYYWQGVLTLAINELNEERAAQGLGKLEDENGIVIKFP